MTGASHLRLTLHRDTDGTAELRARVESAGFAGESAAWFNVREVAAFARALDAYPIDAARPPQLSGGVFSQSDHDGAGEPALEREQLFIAVRPAGRRGTLAVEVRLATPRWGGDAEPIECGASVTFLADYAALQRFAGEVARLAAGQLDAAVLRSDVTYT